jgi:WD40 repeat protein
MSWSEDSKRIIGGGSGRQAFGEAFFADSGSSVGQISGHSKTILTVDFKQSRPYRAASGSEDFAVNFYEGPPFRFLKTMRDHTKYVNCVRFSPDGNKLVSVSSDKRGILYDGKSGDLIGELSQDNGHSASIYSCCWNDDNRRLFTVSADHTAKIWDADSYQCLQTFTFPNDVNHMQVGCLWQGDYMVTVNLRGDISILDNNNPDRPQRVIHGHNKKINTLAYDRANHRVYTADIDGYMIEWNLDDGRTSPFEGTSHTNQVTKLIVSGGNLISIAFDDSIKISSIANKEYGPSIPLEGQPVDVAAHGNSICVVTPDKFIVLENDHIVSQQPLTFQATCIAIHPNGNEVAIGGKDNLVHVFNKNGNNLTQKYNLNGNQGYVTCVDYSPSGQYLASGGSGRQVVAWEGQNPKCKMWVYHTTMVTSVSWSSDNEHVVSGSVDTNLIVWSLSKPIKRIVINGAHYGGVTGCVWLDVNTCASVGDDCCLKTWSVTHH